MPVSRSFAVLSEKLDLEEVADHTALLVDTICHR